MGMRFNRLKKASIKRRISGIGIMFPATDSKTASYQGILNNMMATGMDPRSSITGSIEMISTMRTGLKPWFESQTTVESAKLEACREELRNSPDTIKRTGLTWKSKCRFTTG